MNSGRRFPPHVHLLLGAAAGLTGVAVALAVQGRAAPALAAATIAAACALTVVRHLVTREDR